MLLLLSLAALLPTLPGSTLPPRRCRWGAVRAAMGHAQPWPLRYLTLGNEGCLRPWYAQVRWAGRARGQGEGEGPHCVSCGRGAKGALMGMACHGMACELPSCARQGIAEIQKLLWSQQHLTYLVWRWPTSYMTLSLLGRKLSSAKLTM
jgi:hypothetical protein